MKLNTNTIIRGAVLLVIVIYLITAYPAFEPFPALTAVLVSETILLYTGVMPVVYDNYIFMNLYDQIYIIDVSQECSGVGILAVFAFVIFITPGIKLHHQLLSLGFLPILYIANVFRIVSSIIVGQMTSVDGLLLFHSSIGQVIIFSAMILVYIVFLKTFGYLKHTGLPLQKRVQGE